MDGELATLASSAATTIVTLLATDGWGEVREKIGGLWRRFRPDQVDDAVQDIDRAHAEIATADQTVSLAITREWESRLLRLLAAETDAGADLTRILAELSRSRPDQRRGAVRQTAKASGHSTVIQVGGDAAISRRPLSADSREERS